MNKQIILNQRANQIFDTNIFQIKQKEIPQLKQNDVLIKVLYISIDASMRIWITGKYSYMKGVQIGDVMNAFAVGRVIESQSELFKKDDLCTGLLGWQEYSIQNDKEIQKIPYINDPKQYLSIKGIAGLTAYFGLTEIGQIKKGETVLVSSAAGGVGVYVVQIAKLMGCKVIGIVGSQNKQKFVKEIGADECLNYNDKDFSQKLKNLPKFEVFFDNVGGQILDQVLLKINNYGRIISCGAISTYQEQNYDLKNYFLIVSKRLKIQGFIYFDYIHKINEAFQFIDQGLKNNQIKCYDMIFQGLESCPESLNCLLQGKNIGKIIVDFENKAKI